MARVALLLYDFYGVLFLSIVPWTLLLRRAPHLRLPSTLAAQRVETGRVVNYQEGILIKFFIVAAQVTTLGAVMRTSGDLILSAWTRCFYFPFAYLNL